MEIKSKLSNKQDVLKNLIDRGIQALRFDLAIPLTETEVLARMNYVQMVVSLWSHTCMIDGELAQAEEMSVGQLINYFFGENDALFPIDQIDIDPVFSDITETFLAPIPLNEVLCYGSELAEVANSFYEQACSIVASDDKLHDKERAFLDNLAEELQISRETQLAIELRHFENLA